MYNGRSGRDPHARILKLRLSKVTLLKGRSPLDDWAVVMKIRKTELFDDSAAELYARIHKLRLSKVKSPLDGGGNETQKN